MMRKNRLKENRGFTLAELLLVVAIIAVVAAIGILAIGNERKNKTAMAYDDTAMQIYLLAQNRLLQMKEFGEWEAFQAKYDYETLADDKKTERYGQEIVGMPSDYSYWKSITGYDRDYTEDQAYMRVLSTKELRENGNGKLLEELLPNGSFEDSVRNYLIEYNVKTATVYGVFYSESDFEMDSAHSGSYYGDIPDNEDNGRFVGDNKTEARNIRKEFGASTILGYFGGGMVSGLAYADVPMPEVIVYNGEDLVLYIENNYNPAAFGDSVCNVEIRGAASGHRKAYDIVTVDTALAPSGYCLNPVGNTVAGNYLMVIKNVSGNPAGSYAVVLDSLTNADGAGASNQEFRFNENFGTGSDALWPGEDLEITVKVTAKNAIGLPGVRTVKTNSLFASVGDASEKMLSDGTTKMAGGIEISAFRHLMNLDHDRSGVNLSKQYTVDAGTKYLFPSESGDYRRAYLSSNISFDLQGEDLRTVMPLASRNYVTEGVPYMPVGLDLSGGVKKFYLSGKEDDASSAPAFRIYDLSITGSAGNIGLFGEVSGGSSSELVISNLGIVKASDSSNETCIQVTSAGDRDDVSAGAFVGSASCNVTIENCYSTVLLQAVSTNIDGTDTNKYNLGGLTGHVGGNLTVGNSYVSGRTAGGRYAPIGSFYNIGFHTGGKNTVTNVGGLAGSVGGTLNIDSSYCVASIGNRDNNGYNNDMKAGAYNIGGLVGKTQDAVIANSYFYAYADIPDIEKLAGNDVNIRLGGLIGNGTGACSVGTDCSYIEEYLSLSDVIKTQDGKPATLSGDAVETDTDLAIDGDFKAGSTIDTYRYTFSFANDTDEPSDPVDLGLVYPGMVACGSAPTTAKTSPFNSVPFDSTLIDEVEHNGKHYPYPDVTGLNHHFGDWSQELPASTIVLEAGIGVAELSCPSSWNPVKDADGNDIPGKWCIKNVPAGTDLDIESLVSGIMTLKTGYQGLACSRSYSRIDKKNDSSTDWIYTTKGMDAVITVNAAEIVPLVLSCPDESEANTTDAATEYPVSGRRYESGATGNGNYRRVFGYQDVPMEIRLRPSDPAVPQGYDPDITLCFIWAEKDEEETEYVSQVSNPAAAASYNDMCIVTDVNNPVCYYYANKKQAGEDSSVVSGASIPAGTNVMSMDQFADVNAATFAPPEGQSGSTDVGKYIPVIKKKAYYGNRQYRLQAYAYATRKEGTDVLPVTWLRTSLSAPIELSAALDRVPVSFVYDDDDTIESSVTAAENIFGKYRIDFENSQGAVNSVPDGEMQAATFYIEYEDTDSTERLRFFENNGVMDPDRSSYAYNSEDEAQQTALGSVPTAVFDDVSYAENNPNRTRADVLFRGWQDAGRPVGYTDPEKTYTDWNWDEFKHEMSGRYYGPDVWYDDNNGTNKPDGEEMLVFELKEGEENPASLTPHGGVKGYLVEDDENKLCYFRPERPDPIQLKARWWRVPVEVGGDPNGGYY